MSEIPETPPAEQEPPPPRPTRVRALMGRIPGGAYTVAGALMFLVTALARWRGYVRNHEAMYFLGPHRVADPELLANDISWMSLPPTTWLYDHLLAPLWFALGEMGIATLGRLVFWICTAVALTLIGRALRLPPWTLVIGHMLWLFSDQSLAGCGSPIEGFQPKAMSYPLMYFALVLAMRGRVLWAGASAGLGTAFHIIVGGWGCFAVFASMLISRRYSMRQLATFIAGTAPFVLPVLIATVVFSAPSEPGVQAQMDEIYVEFAAPHCVDPDMFMSPSRWLKIPLVFLITSILLYRWPRTREARFIGHFVTVLAGVFGLGVVAYWFDQYWFMKLFPYQLGKGIPSWFFFVMVLAYCVVERPLRRLARVALYLGLVVGIWLVDKEDAIVTFFESPGKLHWREHREGRDISYANRKTSVPIVLYGWIREWTPKDAVFITPHLGEFWVLAERAQVASVRHPPIDEKIIEWHQRIEDLNGGPFPDDVRGFDIGDTLTRNVCTLKLDELIELRDKYLATHYLCAGVRPDLQPYMLQTSEKVSVYDLTAMVPPEDSKSSRPGDPASRPPQPPATTQEPQR